MTACGSSTHEWVDRSGNYNYQLISEVLYPLQRSCKADSECQVDTIPSLTVCGQPVLGAYLAAKATEWGDFKTNLERARNSVEVEPCLNYPYMDDRAILGWIQTQPPVAICSYGECRAKQTLQANDDHLNFVAAARLSQTIRLTRQRNNYKFTVRNGDESVEGEVSEAEAEALNQAIGEIHRCTEANFYQTRYFYEKSEISNFTLNERNAYFCASKDLDAVEESVQALKTLISSKLQDPSPAILESLQAFENWKIETLER